MALGKKQEPLAAGTAAADFCLPSLEGGETTLRDITSEGPALLAFFKVNCPVCQLTFPYLGRIHTPDRLPVYGVSQNDSGETRIFNQRYGVTFPTLLDNEDNGFAASNAFGISTVPTIFLIERDGTVSRVIEGWQKKEMQGLAEEAGIRPFLEGEAVPEWKAG